MNESKTDNRKKVLIVAGGLNMGGLENQLVYLGKNVDQTRFKIDYSATNKNAYYRNDIIKSNCGFYVLPDPRKDGTLKYCVALYKLMKSGEYDVVHSQELFHSGIEMFIAWLARVPKRISHSHSTKDGSGHNRVLKKTYHLIMRMLILMCATDYLACSTAAGMFLYGKNIIQNKKFKVIVNSVETGKFFCESENNKSVINKQNAWKYVAHVGRFVDVKNHEFMLDIVQEIAKNNLPIKFVFVGDGELYDNCVERVQVQELTKYVQFMGQRKDVADILNECDAFILPSFYEGMPLSLIEAQAAGLPCLVADHITDEADFSLGLINKLSLQQSARRWMQGLLEIIEQKCVDKEVIKNAIHKKGFDVLDFKDNLCNIYCGDLK